MKKAGVVLTLLAVLTLASPPTLHAKECYTYENRSLHYFPDCACSACAGWSASNCTDCGLECMTTVNGGDC